jgi:hypothetical protein
MGSLGGLERAWVWCILHISFVKACNGYNPVFRYLFKTTKYIKYSNTSRIFLRLGLNLIILQVENFLVPKLNKSIINFIEMSF